MQIQVDQYRSIANLTCIRCSFNGFHCDSLAEIPWLHLAINFRLTVAMGLPFLLGPSFIESRKCP